jgi:hypothetical protein
MSIPIASPHDVLAFSLRELILTQNRRHDILKELRHCLFVLDNKIVQKCSDYLETNPDADSMVYKTARNYLRKNFSRRPLFIAIHTIDQLLANPNFLREFYVILVVFVQFNNAAKKSVCPHTIEPVFGRYFGQPSFYPRFQTFMPNSQRIQTVDQFIRTEFSHLLVSLNTNV